MTEPTSQDPVVLGLSSSLQLSISAVITVVGMALGAALPWVARFAVGLPWAPFQGPLKLIAAMNLPLGLALGLAAGLALGVFVAMRIMRETVRVTVTGQELAVMKDSETRTIARSETAAVFLDGEHLVVLDGTSREIVRDEVEAEPDEVKRAFQEFGYPWHDEDPHASDYQRWVQYTPAVPGDVNAVFAARQTALEKDDSEEAADLRNELSKKGYVVRDEKKRQYWRPAS